MTSCHVVFYRQWEDSPDNSKRKGKGHKTINFCSNFFYKRKNWPPITLLYLPLCFWEPEFFLSHCSYKLLMFYFVITRELMFRVIYENFKRQRTLPSIWLLLSFPEVRPGFFYFFSVCSHCTVAWLWMYWVCACVSHMYTSMYAFSGYKTYRYYRYCTCKYISYHTYN